MAGASASAWMRVGALSLAMVGALLWYRSVLVEPGGRQHLPSALPVLVGALAVAVGVVVRRPAATGAWLLLAAGRAVIFVAEVQRRPLAGSPTQVQLTSQLVQLVGYVLTGSGLIVLARHLTRVWDRTRWIDSVAVSLGIALAGSAALVWPFLPVGAGWAARWLVPTYPALDLMLVLLAIRSLLAARPRTSSLKLLTAALGLQLVGEVATLWVAPSGVAVPPAVRPLTLGAASLLIGVSALVPSVSEAPCRVIPWRRLGWIRFTVLTTSLVLPLSVLAGLAGAGQVLPATIAYLSLGAAVIGVLVLVRVSGLVTYADTLADERHRSRFEALADHSHDAVAIFDRGGKVSWASPAVRSVLAHAPEMLVGKPVDDMFGPAGAREMSGALTSLRGRPVGATVDLRASVVDGKGRERIVEGTATNLLDEPSVEGLVLVVRDVTERFILQELAEQAFLDPLTGLANRKLFDERIALALANRPAPAAGRGVAIVYIDLDDFKVVNDSLGHGCGDELLVVVGQRLTGAIGSGDTAARLGGDEFCVLLEPLTRTEAAGAAERMLGVIGSPIVLAGRSVTVTASIGVAHADGSTDSTAALLEAADAAMYESKRHGKGQVRLRGPEVPDRGAASPSW